MPAIVPGYEHDIFVSYALVDNLVMPGAKDGWVSTLIAGLKIQLGQKLGRIETFKLWKDEKLTGNEPFPATIEAAIKQSATLVIILSPGYLASEWCQKELNTFLQMVANDPRGDSRVFVVERDKLEVTEKPRSVRDQLGYRFWVEEREGKAPRILGTPMPHPSDRLYYDKLGDLAHDLAEEIKRLKHLKVPDTRPAVFLAEVTDDLDKKRDEVQRYLDQEGFRVIPADTTLNLSYLTGNDEPISKAMAGCKLFVQLLSSLAGKRRGNQLSFPQLQYETARKANIPILQWRKDKLDMDDVEDEDQRILLQGDTVLAIGLEEFKQEVVKRAKTKPQPDKVKPVGVGKNLVFLNTNEHDRQLGKDLGELLKQKQIGFALPMAKGDPVEIRQELEQWVLDCDGLIIVYGIATYQWARAQIMQCRKMLVKREQELKALAIFEGPPEEKDPLDIELPGMHTLNCRKGLQEDALQSFLDALHQPS